MIPCVEKVAMTLTIQSNKNQKLSDWSKEEKHRLCLLEEQLQTHKPSSGYHTFVNLCKAFVIMEGFIVLLKLWLVWCWLSPFASSCWVTVQGLVPGWWWMDAGVTASQASLSSVWGLTSGIAKSILWPMAAKSCPLPILVTILLSDLLTLPLSCFSLIVSCIEWLWWSFWNTSDHVTTLTKCSLWPGTPDGQPPALWADTLHPPMFKHCQHLNVQRFLSIFKMGISTFRKLTLKMRRFGIIPNNSRQQAGLLWDKVWPWP